VVYNFQKKTSGKFGIQVDETIKEYFYEETSKMTYKDADDNSLEYNPAFQA